jgi:hypothetical protein
MLKKHGFSTINPPLYRNFSDYTLCVNRDHLTAEQEKTFLDRHQELQYGKCRLIYRGENKIEVVKKYGLSQHSIPHEFNDMLFLIGGKGRYFLDKITRTADAIPEKHGIADSTDKFFRDIFNMLRDLFISRRFSAAVQHQIDNFKLREPTVTQFFSLLKHKKAFLEAINGLSEKNKIKIRDYYLTLLHHLGQSQYYPVSFLLSATSDLRVAKKFSDQARRQGNEIIFFGWVPWGSGLTLSTFQFPSTTKPDLLSRIGLPRYRQSFFPSQKEITLKGGMLPHYLLGYLHTYNGHPTFEVNPNVFRITNADWIKNGLPVDQTEFWSQLSKTTFKTAFILHQKIDEYSEL